MQISERLGEDLMSESAKERSKSYVKPEFDRVTAGVRLLQRADIGQKSLDELQKIFAGADLGRNS